MTVSRPRREGWRLDVLPMVALSASWPELHRPRGVEGGRDDGRVRTACRGSQQPMDAALIARVTEPHEARSDA